jgi:hypothetical protein
MAPTYRDICAACRQEAGAGCDEDEAIIDAEDDAGQRYAEAVQEEAGDENRGNIQAEDSSQRIDTDSEGKGDCRSWDRGRPARIDDHQTTPNNDDRCRLNETPSAYDFIVGIDFHARDETTCAYDFIVGIDFHAGGESAPSDDDNAAAINDGYVALNDSHVGIHGGRDARGPRNVDRPR